MWKWVTLLVVGMYVTLMAFGGEGYDPSDYANAAPAPVEPEAAPAIVVVEEPEVATLVEPEVVVVEPDPVVEATIDAPTEILPAPAQPAAVEVTQSAIEAIAPVAEPAPAVAEITVASVEPTPVARASTLEQTPAPAPEIWKVTGSRVNLRAAASTQSQVVGRTVRGDSAEIIELLPNGWAKVYIIDSGIEAFMSAKFIAPES